MADLTQIEGQIKYQLSQLSSRNAHHEFEHLCRHLTQARICSNVLPATGPVSAGGDQGRDFETFKTYLASSSIADSTFIGLATDKTVVFACSVQKDNILTKIKSDVKKIMAKGSIVDEIIYFCVSDVEVAKRHKLQEWAKDNYSIEIDVHDGNSIAALLAQRDVFWIAGRFLDISSEIYPRSEIEESWYKDALDSWKTKEPANYSDFYEIKSLMRHATHDQNDKQDVPFWIDLMENYVVKDTPLTKKAIYEISVASLRGIGTLIGKEELLREYFQDISKIESIDQLEDTAVLLTYCVGARKRDLVQFSEEELKKWHSKILNEAENKIHESNVTDKCFLLDLKAFLYLTPFSEAPLNIDISMNCWLELVEMVENAPLFPLDQFADRITFYTPLVGNHPDYDRLTKKIDLLLANRTGDFNAAEKCRDRAINFYEVGEILKAINQLHTAKVKWFSKETLYGSLLGSILISGWYNELGLTFAAKYYALASAYLAHKSSNDKLKKLIPQSLFLAALCDYYQGSWCGFLELMKVAIIAHYLFSKDPDGVDIHQELERAIYSASIVKFTTDSFFDQTLADYVNQMLGQWPSFSEDVHHMAIEAQKKFQVNNVDELLEIFEGQLIGRPFGDCGEKRIVEWLANGLKWQISWKNDYSTTLISEQFIAIIQIFLADLANIDLCLLKTEIEISIAIKKDIKVPNIEPVSSNEGRKWKIDLPNYQSFKDIEELQSQFIALASEILDEVSLLSREELLKVIKNSFKNGISMKTFIARPYSDLLREFISEDAFDNSNRSKNPIPQRKRSFELKEHEELKWIDGPGPTYNKKKAEEFLANRYRRLVPPIKYTLNRLIKNSTMRLKLEELRDKGWLDWHILTVVNNLALNYRVSENIKKNPAPPLIDDDIWFDEQLNRIIDKDEDENLNIPFEIFDIDEFYVRLQITMIHTIQLWDLHIKQLTPDLTAIEHFLRHRYNYWRDDIDHENILNDDNN